MTNKSQHDRVVYKLLHDGWITRNECLKNYISRLGAIICTLQTEGWEFETEYVKTEQGKDYKYTVKKAPYRNVTYTVADGRTITKLEKV